MNEKELVIEGEKYYGRFLIKECFHTYDERVDTEVGYYNHTVTSHWYEGEGLIVDKELKEKQKFLICPLGNKESDFIIFNKNNRENIMKRVQHYPGIIDLSLQYMYEDAKISAEIVPKIKPIPLRIEELVNQGLLSEESGQMRIRLCV